MLNFDIPPQKECRKTKTKSEKRKAKNEKRKTKNKDTIFGLNSNVEIGFQMSKYDIRPQCECQNRTLSVRRRYSASV